VKFLTNYPRVVLWLAFAVSCLIYLLIKFKVYLFPDFDGADIWNSIVENVTLTLATSLGFWFVTEGVSSLFSSNKTNQLEREFLDEALHIWNNSIHSLTDVHPSKHEKLPSYIETHTQDQLKALLNEWEIKWLNHHHLEPGALREDWEYRTAKNIIKKLKKLRKKYVPYESQLSKEFNERYHAMTQTFAFYTSYGGKRDQDAALRLFSVTRRELISMENVLRARKKEPFMKGQDKRIEISNLNGITVTREVTY